MDAIVEGPNFEYSTYNREVQKCDPQKCEIHVFRSFFMTSKSCWIMVIDGRMKSQLICVPKRCFVDIIVIKIVQIC